MARSRPVLTGQDTVRFAGLVGSVAAFGALLVAAIMVAALVGTGATAAPQVPGLAAPPAATRFGIPLARALLEAAAVTTAGVALLARLLAAGTAGDRLDRRAAREASEDRAGVLARARRVALAASLAWAAAALVLLVLLTWDIGVAAGTGFPTAGRVVEFVGAVAVGKGLVLSAGCALLCAVLWLLSARSGDPVPAELRLGTALFGLLPLPLTGHGRDWDLRAVAVISTELHVVAVALWGGGLLAVVCLLARRRALLAAALPRLSVVATWCVLVVGATGLVNGLAELASSPVALPQALWATRYGVLVLAKAGCLAVIAGIALLVRRRLLPAAAAGGRAPVALWCGWELLVMALAIGVAAVLSGTPATHW